MHFIGREKITDMPFLENGAGLMRVLKAVMALMVATLLAGCYFQSDTLLATPMAGGDPILGFGENGPVHIRLLGAKQGATATIVPQKQGDGSVRYEFVPDPDAAGSHANEDKVYLNSMKLTDDRYILRYTSIKVGTAAQVQDTQLAFLSVHKGQYSYLINIADKTMIQKIFPVESERPKNNPKDEGIIVENLAQAKAISLYFHDHQSQFVKDKDYGRVKIIK